MESWGMQQGVGLNGWDGMGWGRRNESSISAVCKIAFSIACERGFLSPRLLDFNGVYFRCITLVLLTYLQIVRVCTHSSWDRKEFFGSEDPLAGMQREPK